MNMRDLINLCEGKQLVEMPTPTPEMKATRYFHGTKTTAAAESIMAHGLKGVEVQKRGQLSPVAGRVYMTPSIQYATIYALGGVLMGSTYFEQRPPEDRYGYVFVISGIDADVQPDEDSIGEFAANHSVAVENERRIRTGWRFDSNPSDPDNEEKRRVWTIIFNAMTPTQRVKAFDGYYAYQAAGGKRALKILSDHDKMLLLKWGAHLAVAGVVSPSECWRIDKLRAKELAEDSSNFFEIAERIR